MPPKNRFIDQSFDRNQVDRKPLDIRYSPYQSPFVPSSPKGVYWIGAEYKEMPHNAHVYAWVQELGRRHVYALQLEYASAVALLPILDEMAGQGVKASARRARDVRSFLSPHKKFSPHEFKVLAKKSIARQRQEQGA